MKIWRRTTTFLGVVVIFVCAGNLQAQSVSITTSSLPQGVVGVAYSQTVAATGGVKPYAWSIVSGSLPSGMSLDALTGTISGTSTTAATSNFKIRVTTANLQTNEKNLSITINPVPLTITTSSLSDGVIGEDSALGRGLWSLMNRVFRALR